MNVEPQRCVAQACRLRIGFLAGVLSAWLAACGTEPAATSDVLGTDGAGDDAADTLADGGPSDGTTADGATGEVVGNDAINDGSGAKYPICAQVMDCVEAQCTATPTVDCQQACVADGGPAATTKAKALLACAQSKCVQGQCKDKVTAECMNECTSSACLPEVLTCVDSPFTGSQPCGTIKACFEKCVGPGRFACEAKCMGTLTPEAREQAFDFAECLAGPAAQGNPLLGCLPQITACFDTEKKGQKACYEALDGLSGCGSGDGFQCMVDLLKTLTPAGQTALGEVLPCLGQDITPTAACTDKTLACIAPTGVDNCEKSLLCATACTKSSGGGDPGPGCVYGCLHTGTIAGGKTLLTVLGCDPAKDPSCVDGFLECVAPSGTDTCAGILGCASTCPKIANEPDMACTIDCIQAGSVASAKTAFTAMGCSGKTDGGCKDIQQTCYNPSGTKNCVQLGACIQGCGNSSTSGKCVGACYADASVPAFQEFSAWTQCYDSCSKSCGADNSCMKSCFSSTCPQALAACTST